jgi:2-iminoacetate synthase ThiH
MLPDRPRKAIAPLKESGARWLEVMTVAHRNGLSSTATMMMGTGETNAERIEHIWMIRTAGRIPAQRDTLYRHLAVHETEADDPTDDRVVSHFSSTAMPGGGAGRTELPLVDVS